MKKPALHTIPDWYQGYVKAVPDVNLMESLTISDQSFLSTINRLSDQQSLFRYEQDKWSIKDLILHLSDAERVFSYRALRFTRLDKTNLAGYDHNDYVQQANADHRPLNALIDEYKSVRNATLSLFATFSEEELSRGGNVGSVRFSVVGLGFIISGHQLHHLNIIRERYLPYLPS